MTPTDTASVRLRPTRPDDLEFVLALEQHPDNSPWVGSWTRQQHLTAISAAGREHWIITAGPDYRRVGYLIVLDLQPVGRGLHIKRMVVADKGQGIGRAALRLYARHAFETLGAPYVWLDVLADNLAAQTAYRAAGFERLPIDEVELEEWKLAVGGFDDPSLLMFLHAPER